MKRFSLMLTVFCWLMVCSPPAMGEAAQWQKIPPSWPVPEYVEQLIAVATEEVGYTEGTDGSTKYGQWVNDPKCQWCAEYLCWSVDQTDKRFGTQLLRNIYPKYGASNIGLRWFLQEGRYTSRSGFVNGWGSQWYIGSAQLLQANDYIPQPGDWVFFSYTPSGDTTHVAMVEYCTRNNEGRVRVHVLEGNNPDRVRQAIYEQTDWRILGYGTVHEVTDLVLRAESSGVKVRQLQEKLALLGYLGESAVTGVYGSATAEAVRAFQTQQNLTVNGIANHQTQLALGEAKQKWLNEHVECWTVDVNAEAKGE